MKTTVSDEVRFLIMGDPSANIIRCNCKYCNGKEVFGRHEANMTPNPSDIC
jgi:hypothetical protein